MTQKRTLHVSNNEKRRSTSIALGRLKYEPSTVVDTSPITAVPISQKSDERSSRQKEGRSHVVGETLQVLHQVRKAPDICFAVWSYACQNRSVSIRWGKHYSWGKNKEGIRQSSEGCFSAALVGTEKIRSERKTPDRLERVFDRNKLADFFRFLFFFVLIASQTRFYSSSPPK